LASSASSSPAAVTTSGLISTRLASLDSNSRYRPHHDLLQRRALGLVEAEPKPTRAHCQGITRAGIDMREHHDLLGVSAATFSISMPPARRGHEGDAAARSTSSAQIELVAMSVGCSISTEVTGRPPAGPLWCV
jgi:hypothetical protein